MKSNHSKEEVLFWGGLVITFIGGIITGFSEKLTINRMVKEEINKELEQ